MKRGWGKAEQRGGLLVGSEQHTELCEKGVGRREVAGGVRQEGIGGCTTP